MALMTLSEEVKGQGDGSISKSTCNESKRT